MCSHNGKGASTRFMTSDAIGCTATSALLEEVSVHPKPGLVTPYDTGAHNDMDAALFGVSAKALQPYFAISAQKGAEWHQSLEGLPTPEQFRELRPIGIKAEEAMFNATGGVNTHKGAFFSLGILCACAGHASAGNKPLTVLSIIERCKSLTSGLVASDFAKLAKTGKASSAGEKLYLQYGVTGIRGQAESGFSAVCSISLPILEEALADGCDPNSAAVNVLLHLMCETEDTNVLHRAGPEGLAYVQKAAAYALKQGGMFTHEGTQTILRMSDDFRHKRISPGGCADLLAVTIFLYDLSVLSAGQYEKTFTQLKQRRTYSGTAIPFTTVCAG